MTRTVVALYDNFADANTVVRELVDNGYSRDEISLMAGDKEGSYSSYLSGEHTDLATETAASEGAGVGAGIGATIGGIGGLLVGLGALVIPGIGPVLAAGPLSAALAGLAGAGAGALAGGVTGGLIGALVDAGVPEETAQYFSEGVRRGGTLVSVRTMDDMSDRAVNIMNRHNPVDINSRSTAWRREGYDPTKPFESFEKSEMIDKDGSLHSTVDTGIESTEQRFVEPHNIPNTGNSDRGIGHSGINQGQQTTSQGTFGSTGQPSSEMNVSHQIGDRELGESSSVLDRSGMEYKKPEEHNVFYGGTRDSEVSTDRVYQDYNYYDAGFKTHFSGLFGMTNDYDQYRPAYRYGYDLAVDPRYANREWTDVEGEAKRYWDDREVGAWDRFKDAIVHAWNEVRRADF